MRLANWGLAAVLGALLMMSAGAGQARADTDVVLCNQANVTVFFAVTGHPTTGDPRYMISGWFVVNPGSCLDINSVGNGWAYFYAETDGATRVWGGRDQRFCVNYPGPFRRYISDDYNCSGPFLKSFQGLYLTGGTATMTAQ